jgi:hypothetical protein
MGYVYRADKSARVKSVACSILMVLWLCGSLRQCPHGCWVQNLPSEGVFFPANQISCMCVQSEIWFFLRNVLTMLDSFFPFDWNHYLTILNMCSAEARNFGCLVWSCICRITWDDSATSTELRLLTVFCSFLVVVLLLVHIHKLVYRPIASIKFRSSIYINHIWLPEIDTDCKQNIVPAGHRISLPTYRR